MKSITMPLEEYNQEIGDLKTQRDLRSFEEGARLALQCIRENVISGRPTGWFKNAQLSQLVDQLVLDLKKDKISSATLGGTK